MLRASCNDGIGISVPNSPEGLPDAVGSCGTGGYNVKARAFCLMLDGNVACRNVGNHGGYEERGDPLSGRVFNHFCGFTVLDVKAAYSGAYINSKPERVYVGILSVCDKAGLLHGLPGGRHGIQREVVLLSDEGLLHAEFLRVKVLDFSRKGDGHVLEFFHVIYATVA